MGKDMFVTSGLCKIREQISASTRKQSAEEAEKAEKTASAAGQSETSAHPAEKSAVGKAYDFEAFSAETKRALILREEECERLRKEALLRLHELELLSARNREYARSLLEKCAASEEMITRLRETAESLPEMDRAQESYRKVLAENSRAVDRVRMEILDVRSLLPADAEQKNAGNGGNLFAELDSVTFSQILRVAWALSMPLIITLAICALLVGVMMLLTFRVGL